MRPEFPRGGARGLRAPLLKPPPRALKPPHRSLPSSTARAVRFAYWPRVVFAGGLRRVRVFLAYLRPETWGGHVRRFRRYGYVGGRPSRKARRMMTSLGIRNTSRLY
ncbi:MAG: hypothetical protein H0T60_19240 [Acidobacteria bacterium]|nr:hypothetical protein [Acidobacteriota bacterium]